MKNFDLVKSVTELCSVSGREHMVFGTLRERFGHMFDEIRESPTGSFTGIKRCGRRDAPRLLFDAHIDEIGFMVKEICEDGFLKVVNIGGIDTKVLSAEEVWIFGKEKIAGVFAALPPHLLKPGDEKKKLALSDMCIDTCRSKEYLEENVPIGSVACFKTTTEKLLCGHIVGKSMDDKLSVCAILGALQLLDGKELFADIYAQFSGGEEIGYKGATTDSYVSSPDFAVVIDVTNAYVPEMPKKEDDNKLDCGGVVSFSATTSRPFTKRLISVLEAKGIPYQLSGEPGRTGTNAQVVQISRGGVPTALISIPLKNMHTAAETASLSDLENVSKTLAALALSFEKEVRGQMPEVRNGRRDDNA